MTLPLKNSLRKHYNYPTAQSRCVLHPGMTTVYTLYPQACLGSFDVAVLRRRCIVSSCYTTRTEANLFNVNRMVAQYPGAIRCDTVPDLVKYQCFT